MIYDDWDCDNDEGIDKSVKCKWAQMKVTQMILFALVRDVEDGCQT